MVLRLDQMFIEGFAQLRIPRRLCHFRQGIRQLCFRVENVLHFFNQ
jgi:hypothetical protein